MNREEFDIYLDAEIFMAEDVISTNWLHSSRHRLMLAAISGVVMMILQPHSWPMTLCIMN